MKILLIGGKSSLGVAIKNKLSEFHEVYTVGKNDCDFKLDLLDDVNKIDIPMSFDVVINTAAIFGGESVDEMINTIEVNVIGTLKACHLTSKVSATHFILISSMSAILDQYNQYFGIYSITKRHSDEIAELYCRLNNISLTTLLPSQIYGDNLSFNKHQPFLYKMAENAKKSEDIEIYGSNDATRNYIHSDDLNNIINRVIEKKVYGRFKCVSPNNIRYSELANICTEVFKSNGKVFFNLNKKNIPDNSFEYDKDFYEKIDFFPQITMKEGITRIAILINENK